MPEAVIQTEKANLELMSGKSMLHILKDVTFKVMAGEVTAVVGVEHPARRTATGDAATQRRDVDGGVRPDEDQVAEAPSRLIPNETLGALGRVYRVTRHVDDRSAVIMAVAGHHD